MFYDVDGRRAETGMIGWVAEERWCSDWKCASTGLLSRSGPYIDLITTKPEPVTRAWRRSNPKPGCEKVVWVWNPSRPSNQVVCLPAPRFTLRSSCTSRRTAREINWAWIWISPPQNWLSRQRPWRIEKLTSDLSSTIIVLPTLQIWWRSVL